MFYYSLDVFDSCFHESLCCECVFFISVCVFDLRIRRNSYILLCRPLFICNTLALFFYLFIIFFFLYHQAFAKRVLFTQQYENFILNYNIFSVTVSVHVSNVCQRRRRSQFPKFNSQFSSFFLFISLLAHGPHGKKGGAHQPKCRPFRKTS